MHGMLPNMGCYHYECWVELSNNDVETVNISKTLSDKNDTGLHAYTNTTTQRENNS